MFNLNLQNDLFTIRGKKMKRMSMGLLVGFLAIFMFQSEGFCAAPVKIGVVDMQRFQENSKTFQKIKEKLREKYESLQKKLDTEKAELLKLEEEFRKQSMMLSLDAKEDKQKELEKKRRYYKYLAEEYTQQMKDAEGEARRQVTKELEKVVEKLGRKGGYLMVLERRTIGLVYYDDAIDITDQVTRAYDELKMQ
jgi:outer membrane protein